MSASAASRRCSARSCVGLAPAPARSGRSASAASAVSRRSISSSTWSSRSDWRRFSDSSSCCRPVISLARDAAGVEPLLVARLALADGVDVALQPLLLAVEVAHLGLGPDDVVGELPLGLLGGLDRGELGQGAPAVRQLGQGDVLGGEVEQPLLVEVVGLHALNLPAAARARPRTGPRPRRGGPGPSWCAPVSGRGSPPSRRQGRPAARRTAGRAGRGRSGPPARRCSRSPPSRRRRRPPSSPAGRAVTTTRRAG